MTAKASPETPSGQHYVLKLYVTGATRRSQRAITNLNTICDEYLKDQYVLEVVDIYRFPGKAKEADVLASPTLIREAPGPIRRMIGDLADSGRVLMLLDLRPKGERHGGGDNTTRPTG